MSEMTIEAIRELLRPRHVIACREALADVIRPLVEGYSVEVVVDPAIPAGQIILADLGRLNDMLIQPIEYRPATPKWTPAERKPFALINFA